jgi:hypothetical protein
MNVLNKELIVQECNLPTGRRNETDSSTPVGHTTIFYLLIKPAKKCTVRTNWLT